jgi:glycerol kinase
VRPKISETTALGAAYLAGLAVGYWKDKAEIAAQWQVDRKFVASMKTTARKTATARWTKALQRAGSWADE